MSRLGYGVMAGVLAFAVGCADSADEKAPGGNQEGKVEVPISAAEGGRVELGKATLEIPANSLAADTTITATAKAPTSTLPDQSTLRGQQFVFGPAGTTFDPAATLVLPIPAGTTGKGSVVISWLDEATGKWVDLASATEGNSIVAPVEHFTTFIVRFFGEEPISCDASACGGDPTGTWRLVGGCVTKSPFENGCPDATISGVLDGSTGGLDLTADHYISFFASINGTFHMTVPTSCYANKSQQACSDVGEDIGATCTGDVAVGCDCTVALTDSLQENGTWSVEGTNLVVVPFDERGTTQVPFCVDDGKLWIHAKDMWMEFVVETETEE